MSVVLHRHAAAPDLLRACVHATCLVHELQSAGSGADVAKAEAETDGQDRSDLWSAPVSNSARWQVSSPLPNSQWGGTEVLEDGGGKLRSRCCFRGWFGIEKHKLCIIGSLVIATDAFFRSSYLQYLSFLLPPISFVPLTSNIFRSSYLQYLTFLLPPISFVPLHSSCSLLFPAPYGTEAGRQGVNPLI